ncbi:YveK family protein [Paenibacillus sp. R14(2021)]|uniref:YveK family protein n=1 Tax=Paenibacillus sp. R14(2021) TaxID=2859228 RepID=UPI001C612263|nr:Wzz/FepE/Etk N-terminal domain-containing protein [Paenibacillus sp. R14(2021)]
MELDFKGLLLILRKRLWTIAIITIVAGVVTGVYSYQYIDTKYEASTKIMVNKTKLVNGEEDLNLNDLNAQIRLIATYKEIVRTRWIMDDVVKEHPELHLTANQLASKIKVSSVNDTQVMTFSATDTSYQRASSIIDAVTSEFVKKIPVLMKVDNVTVLNWASAEDASSPISPKPVLNIMIALILAFLLSAAATLIVNNFDDSLKSEEMINDYLDLPVLAAIVDMDKSYFRNSKASQTQNSEKAGESAYVATN